MRHESTCRTVCSSSSNEIVSVDSFARQRDIHVTSLDEPRIPINTFNRRIRARARSTDGFRYFRNTQTHETTLRERLLQLLCRNFAVVEMAHFRTNDLVVFVTLARDENGIALVGIRNGAGDGLVTIGHDFIAALA